jgi:hypothetical protein
VPVFAPRGPTATVVSMTAVRRAWTTVVVVGVGAALLGSGAILVVRSSASPGALAFAVVVALAVSMVAARLDVAAAIQVLDALRVLVPIVASSVVGALIGSRQGTFGFDEVGAQLIVVLLLALALEARFFRVRGDEERLDALAPFLVMALLAVGEAYALAGLLSGHPHHAEMVGGAIAAGFAAVAVSAIVGPGRQSEVPGD